MINKILKPFGLKYQDKILYRKIETKRSFNGAGTGRLLSSWNAQNYSADHLLRQSLSTLRARSRELERNNDYAKKFFRMKNWLNAEH